MEKKITKKSLFFALDKRKKNNYGSGDKNTKKCNIDSIPRLVTTSPRIGSLIYD